MGGFLGSGKTTLLNHILTASHGKKLAVIENEFGDVGIDDGLLKANTKMQAEVEIIEMMNGCICCTVRQDLIVVLNKLAKRVKAGTLKLDGIVIETTGMADPAPVAQTFFVDDDMKEFARLDGIITLVDAKHIEQHLDEVKPEGAENEAVEQLAFADRVLLNKIDLVSEADLERVEERIKAVNSFAPIVRTEKSQVSADSVLNIGAFDLKRTLEMDSEFLNTDGEHEHDTTVTSMSICEPGSVDLDMVQGFVGDILQKKGADIYRMKGVLSISHSEQKFVYQAVHMIFNGNLRTSGARTRSVRASWFSSARTWTPMGSESRSVIAWRRRRCLKRRRRGCASVLATGSFATRAQPGSLARSLRLCTVGLTCRRAWLRLTR